MVYKCQELKNRKRAGVISKPRYVPHFVSRRFTTWLPSLDAWIAACACVSTSRWILPPTAVYRTLATCTEHSHTHDNYSVFVCVSVCIKFAHQFLADQK